MMMFTAAYSVIDDGFFVANFVGKEAFVALNLMAPIIIVMGAIGFMLGTGGNAVISKALGEGKQEKANQNFTLITLFTIVVSVAITAFGLAVLKPACVLMGAKGVVLEDCLTYGKLIFPFTVVFLLQGIFQNFLITAGQPKLSMIITIASGISNIVFDTLLIVILKWGLVGAVWATLSGSIFGTLIPAGYFLFAKNSNLRFAKTPLDLSVLSRTCLNGSSELVTNLSVGLVSMLYNYQLMQTAGNDGVAAFGAIMYVSSVFESGFMGYSMGVAPIVGYNYGAQDHQELKNIFHKSMVILSVIGVTLFALSELGATPFSMIFVRSDKELLAMTVRGMRIYALMYLISGINVFGTGFFTALNNGLVSALLALIRTVVLQVAAVFILPMLWGLDGIWASTFVADLLMLGITIFAFAKLRGKYGY